MSDLESLRLLVRGAIGALERSRQRIDDLNVYPVPDGDTGTNLLLTVRGVAEALARSNADNPENLAREVSRAALLSARGNSGVILSQIIRGAADELAKTSQIDTAAIARALRSAADAAYQALREPVEGTMLTVIRELADEAEAQASSALDPTDLLEALVRRGDQAVAQTQEQLDVLRRAGGTVDAVEIADMHRQTEEREARLGEATRSAVVAVVAGEGNRRLFESLGAARIVEGGQTMNPPAADLLAAVEAANAKEAVLLPNNANVVLTAEQAAALATRPVHVVPTRSIQAGLAALVAFNPERSAEENAEEMRRAVEGVATGEVTTASRDAEIDGLTVEKGDYLGLL